MYDTGNDGKAFGTAKRAAKEMDEALRRMRHPEDYVIAANLQVDDGEADDAEA